MREVMTSGTFEWPEKAQNGLGWLRKYFFLLLLMVPVLSLGNIGLCIMCVRTIAGQKSTEDYIALYSITYLTLYYFPLLSQSYGNRF